MKKFRVIFQHTYEFSKPDKEETLTGYFLGLTELDDACGLCLYFLCDDKKKPVGILRRWIIEMIEVF